MSETVRMRWSHSALTNGLTIQHPTNYSVHKNNNKKNTKLKCNMFVWIRCEPDVFFLEVFRLFFVLFFISTMFAGTLCSSFTRRSSQKSLNNQCRLYWLWECETIAECGEISPNIRIFRSIYQRRSAPLPMAVCMKIFFQVKARPRICATRNLYMIAKVRQNHVHDNDHDGRRSIRNFKNSQFKIDDNDKNT